MPNSSTRIDAYFISVPGSTRCRLEIGPGREEILCSRFCAKITSLSFAGRRAAVERGNRGSRAAEGAAVNIVCACRV